MFKLNVLTPEKKVIVDLEVLEVTVPIYSGEIDVLPGHVPMVSHLGTGVLKIVAKENKTVTRLVISSGYCEISPEGVSVLAESVQMKDDVSETTAKAAVDSAEQKLAKESLSDEDFEATVVEAKKGRAGLQLLN